MAERINSAVKRHQFHVMREKAELVDIMPEPPEYGEIVRLFSFGSFSAIGLVRYFADLTVINHLTVFTLVVGEKHAECLGVMAAQGTLKGASFVVGKLQENRERLAKTTGKYQYNTMFLRLCADYDWEYKVARTHAKVYLFDTEMGKYVVECSANLNTNPWNEQFTIEKSDDVYEYYRKIYEELTDE